MLNRTEFTQLQSTALSHMARTLYVFYLQPQGRRGLLQVDPIALTKVLVSFSTYAPCTPSLSDVEHALEELEHLNLIAREDKHGVWQNARISLPCFTFETTEIPSRPFLMYPSWQPSASLGTIALQSGLSDYNYQDAELQAFVNFWLRRKVKRSQQAWERSFVSRLLQIRSAQASGSYRSNNLGGAYYRTATQAGPYQPLAPMSAPVGAPVGATTGAAPLMAEPYQHSYPQPYAHKEAHANGYLDLSTTSAQYNHVPKHSPGHYAKDEVPLSSFKQPAYDAKIAAAEAAAAAARHERFEQEQARGCNKINYAQRAAKQAQAFLQAPTKATKLPSTALETKTKASAQKEHLSTAHQQAATADNVALKRNYPEGSYLQERRRGGEHYGAAKQKAEKRPTLFALATGKEDYEITAPGYTDPAIKEQILRDKHGQEQALYLGYEPLSEAPGYTDPRLQEELWYAQQRQHELNDMNEELIGGTLIEDGASKNRHDAALIGAGPFSQDSNLKPPDNNQASGGFDQSFLQELAAEFKRSDS